MSIWAATYVGRHGSVIASEDNPLEAITLKFITLEIDIQSLDLAGIEEVGNCSLKKTSVEGDSTVAYIII